MRTTSAIASQMQSPTPILCASAKRRAWKPLAGSLAALLLVAPVFADSDTWKAAPPTSIWNAAGNWVGGSVPNGAADVASFGTSSKLSLSITANTQVNGIIFSAGAGAYTITAPATFTLTISGAGIGNVSGIAQNFVTAVDGAGNFGTVSFTSNAVAGSQTFATETFTSLDRFRIIARLSEDGQTRVPFQGATLPPIDFQIGRREKLFAPFFSCSCSSCPARRRETAWRSARITTGRWTGI